MVQDRTTVKTKIILATIECIEKDGYNAVTTRNVAQAAGVNNAAINYYFGSKDHLLEETFTFTLSHFFIDLNEILKDNDLPTYSLLKVFLSFLLEGIVNYPNLVRAYFSVPDVVQKFGQSFLRQLDQFMETIAERIPKENPALTEREIRLSLMQIISVIISLCLPLDLFQGFSGLDPKDPATQMAYIDHLLTRYLTWVNPLEIKENEQKVAQLLDKIKNTLDFDRPD
ncbi:MAG: TetR/AcrR family transcriptional regulator [Firmicutes bacterium]|nr:TetR/AcrR family transcriptional regulator [Bacillota bacterium]